MATGGKRTDERVDTRWADHWLDGCLSVHGITAPTWTAQPLAGRNGMTSDVRDLYDQDDVIPIAARWPAWTRLLPGIGVALVGVAFARLATSLGLGLSSIVVALCFGAVCGNLGLLPASTGPGLTFVAKRVLRVGIALLGLRLAVADLASIGASGLLVVALTVSITFLGTRALGKLLGVSAPLSLLVATGFSICGASAVAAMRPLSDADDEEAGFAVGLVTIFGTLALVTLPLLDRVVLHLDPVAFGSWVGASVHDVAQVVAAGSSRGEEAASAAIVVKLTRVLLLAPLLFVMGFQRSRQARSAGGGGDTEGGNTARPPLVPLFVAAFLGAVLVRSSGALPAAVISGAAQLEKILIGAAMVGLGASVRWRALLRVGGRPFVLGLVSWVLIATISWVGVVVTT